MVQILSDNTNLSSPSTTPNPTCSTRVTDGSNQPAFAPARNILLRWTDCSHNIHIHSTQRHHIHSQHRRHYETMPPLHNFTTQCTTVRVVSVKPQLHQPQTQCGSVKQHVIIGADDAVWHRYCNPLCICVGVYVCVWVCMWVYVSMTKGKPLNGTT